ncbi:MAG: hypothetical protein WCC48_12280 [Anaeromyxobacteraceae bacterium]
MPCPRQSNCQLADGISMREALRVWQSFYCDGMFRRCERYKLAESGVAVPLRLLPNGRLQDAPAVPLPPAGLRRGEPR